MENVVIPSEVNDKLKTALILEREGQFAEAVVVYRDILQSIPDSGKTWTNLAYNLNALDELEEAQEAFERALALDPTDVYTIAGLGYNYDQMGELEKAEEYFQKTIAALKPGPDLCKMYVRMASLQLRQQQWRSARRNLLMATREDSSSADVYYHLAYLYWSIQRWDEALSAAAKVLSIEPNHADTYVIIRRVLFERGDSATGEKLHHQATALHAKEDEIKRQWSDLAAQMQQDLKIQPFHLDMFLPSENDPPLPTVLAEPEPLTESSSVDRREAKEG